jgi:hypothetical protein
MLTPMAALEDLRKISVERDEIIASEKARFAEIDEQAKTAKEQVRVDHREANRRLVAAMRLAQELGIRIEDSAKMIGKSPQALYKLEAELKRYEEK